MLEKILKVVSKNEEVKKIILNELKKDSEINFFVDLIIEMIEEKNKQFKNIDCINNVTSEENTHLEDIIKEKNENIEELKVNLDRLKIQNKDLSTRLTDIEKENMNLNNKLSLSSETIEKFNNRYKELEYIYSKFNNLSEDTREGLSGIFKNIDNIDLFLFCGAEYNKLEMFWEFIKNAIVNEQHKDDIDDMNKIFDYFFDRYNKVANGIYERIEIRPGEEFDTENHIRKGNKTSGEIKEVLLKGFKNRKTRTVIKKTIVSL